MKRESVKEEGLTIIGLIAVGLAAMFYRYYVITRVWDYVAVRMFHLDPIGLWKAFAISFLIHSMTADFSDKGETDLEKTKRDVFRTFLGISIAWGLGYLFFGR